MIDPRTLPKAELHIHIEGTFEPAQIFQFAQRNNVKLAYPNVTALEEAYKFTDLQSFLNLYYAAMAALRTERDFEELAAAYLQRAKAQGVRHAEIFFDPQAHLERGLSFDTVINGLWAALQRSSREFGITTALIMCFLRDQSEASAMQTLELALPHRDKIIGVGLDSAELGNPPSKFQAVFDRARAGGVLAGRACVRVDARKELADLGALAFADDDLGKRSVKRRLDVRVDLVGLDREQRLAFAHRIAGLLVPRRHQAVDERVGELRKFDVHALRSTRSV